MDSVAMTERSMKKRDDLCSVAHPINTIYIDGKDAKYTAFSVKQPSILCGATAGNLVGWCKQHPENKGCAMTNYDILNIDSVPKMRRARRRWPLQPATVPLQPIECPNHLATVTVIDSIPAAGGMYTHSQNFTPTLFRERSNNAAEEVQFDVVPLACLSLANALTGSCLGGIDPDIYNTLTAPFTTPASLTMNSGHLPRPSLRLRKK
ncbi:hypothetical protein F5Y12DRAFT_688350 [Xylaria sp. FL1777]|nr:hypothetical protein F5Y12DRAFT_688350 [Xylaria sp. FL1777]